MDDEDLRTTVFDCIVDGTGLAESILAAALSRAGKKVLHIDANDYYGAQWSSFTLTGLEEWLQSPSDYAVSKSFERFEWSLSATEAPADATPITHAAPAVDEAKKSDDTKKEDVVEVATDAAVPSSESPTVEQAPQPPHPAVTKAPIAVEVTFATALLRARQFQIDLFPRVLFSRGPLVELLIFSGVGKYLEFKSVDRTFMAVADTTNSNNNSGIGLAHVPCSRADVFASTAIGVVEKRVLMKLLTTCADYVAHRDEWVAAKDKPFLRYLCEDRKLSPKMAAFVAYAIALDGGEKGVLSTEMALAETQRFLGSLGRYGPTPFIWPMYGTSEVAQGFCRTCAVNGGIYVLRRGATSVEKGDDGTVTVRCTEGHVYKSKWAVLGSSSTASIGFDGESASFSTPSSADVSSSTCAEYILRAVYVLAGELLCPSGEKKDAVQVITIPPGVARDGEAAGAIPGSIYAVSVGYSAAATPSGVSLLHVTARASTPHAGALLGPVARHFVRFPENSGSLQEEGMQDAAERRPRVLCAAHFALPHSSRSLSATTAIDGVLAVDAPLFSLDCDFAVEQALRLFRRMCPDDEFLPPAIDPDEVKASSSSTAPEGEGAVTETALPGLTASVDTGVDSTTEHTDGDVANTLDACVDSNSGEEVHAAGASST